MATYLVDRHWPEFYWPHYWPAAAIGLLPSINAGNQVHGVRINWQRIEKRRNADGTVDHRPFALNTWEAEYMDVDIFEELRAQQGKTLSSVVTTDIDNRNAAKQYTTAEIVNAVNGGQQGRMMTGVRIEILVDVS